MDPIVVILVLTAAVMHAVWNAVVKVDGDRLMAMAVVITTTGLLAPLLLLFGPAPSPESWGYIVISALLNNIYFLFLVEAYRVGDLSHAYPLARGSAPLMVAAGAMLVGETLGPAEWAGVALVSGGIISLMLAGGQGPRAGWQPIAYPLLTGLMIAAYTIVDGVGVRLSGSPAGYIGWLFILSPLPIATVAALRRRGRAVRFLRASWKPVVLAGFLNLGSYGLAIWALSLGAMAHVSALRETSVIIAAVIGSRLLGEPLGRNRILSAALVVAGVVLINLAAGG